MTEMEREIESLQVDIRALERTLKGIDQAGFGAAARHNTERALALIRERYAALSAKAQGQGALL